MFSNSTMPLSEIVQQVGVRDDIQVGYDQPVDGAFAVTLNDTDNGHLVFEDGRTGTKWFMPGDKVYITGVPEDDSYSLVSLSAVRADSEVAVEVEDPDKYIEVDSFYDLMGSFEMPAFDVSVSSLFHTPFVSDDNLKVSEIEQDKGVFGDVADTKAYIESNIDESYIVPDGSFIWSEFMNVKYTFADSDIADGAATIDGVFETAGVDAVTYQRQYVHPLFDMNPDSEYYVSWISNYHMADGWSVTDSIFTRDNLFADVLDGCYFDADTGLVYIPKSLYDKREANYEFDEWDEEDSDLYMVQCQMLVMNDEEYDLSMRTLPVYYSIDGQDGVDLSSFNQNGVAYGSFIDTYLAIPLVKDPAMYESLNWKDLVVYLNGAPVSADCWSYDAKTGLLKISDGVVAIQSVDVFVQSLSLTEQVVCAISGNVRETDVLAVEADEAMSHLSFADTTFDNSTVVSEVVENAVSVSGSNPGVDLQASSVHGIQMNPSFSGLTLSLSEAFTSKTDDKFKFTHGAWSSFIDDQWGDRYVKWDDWFIFRQKGIGNFWPPDQGNNISYTYPDLHGGKPGFGATADLIEYGNGSLDGPFVQLGADQAIAQWRLPGGTSISNGKVTLSVSGDAGTKGCVLASCSHSSLLPGTNAETFKYAVVRVLDVGDDWMMLGFGTSQVGAQEAVSVVLVPSAPQDVWVEIQKEIEGKCAEGNPLFDNLSGIKFSVINKDTGAQVATLTTDSNGYAKSDKLKYSKTGFDIQEISIPTNLPLQLNTEKKTIVIDPKENNGVKQVVIADKVKRDPLRLNIIKKLSNGLAGSLDDLANAGISVVGIPFKFEYIPDLNFTWSQAQGNYSSKVHYTFQAKTVKRGNRAIIRLDDTSGCLDSSTVSDLKAKGYWDDIRGYAAFPPGFIVVSEMPHAGVQLLKTKMLYEIPMNGAGHWVTNNSDDDISYGTVEVPEVTVNNKYKTFIIEFPKVDKDTGESEGQGDAVLDAEFELLYQDGESEQVTVNGRKYAKGAVICQMEKFRENDKLMFRLPSEIRGPFPKGLPPGTYLLREKPKSDDADYKTTFQPTTITVTREDVEAVGDGGKIDLTNSKYARPAIPAAGAGNEVKRAGVKLRKVDADRCMWYNIDIVRKKIRNTLGRVFLISGFSWKSAN